MAVRPAPRSAFWAGYAALLVAAVACRPEPGSGGAPTPMSTVTPTAVALSPFAVEVRYDTDAPLPSAAAVEAEDGPAIVVAAAETAIEHRLVIHGLQPGTVYDVRVGEGTGVTGTTDVETLDAPSAPFRVLFDNAHGEQAGNADWVIDNDQPAPAPASPATESGWSGAYSAWGFALFETGRYLVETLPPGESFTFGSSGTQDLANFHAVVLPEPNNRLSASEISALADFVAHGGGAFLIANHEGSDRDNDGWESYSVLNELPADSPAWGFELDPASFASFPALDGLVADPREPLLHGPYGDVGAIGFYGATTLSIDREVNPRLRGIAWRPNQDGDAGLLVAAGWFGLGRVVLIGDSSPADDGTASPGNSNIYDSWHDESEDNAAFFLNATAWLCAESG